MSVKDFATLVPPERRYRIGRSVPHTVDARKVWKALEVKTPFRRWIAGRIKRYGFREGRDFVTVPGEGRETTEYHVTLDMAKELGMTEATRLGHEIRLHFIETEKRLRENARTRALTIPVHRQFAEAVRDFRDWVATVNPESAYVIRPGAPFDTFQRMIYKPLFNLTRVPKNFRDRLGDDHLRMLKATEQACVSIIHDEMGRHGDDYKAAFEAIKERVRAVIKGVGSADLSGQTLPDPLFR